MTLSLLELQARVDWLPRFSLALRPTPLEALPAMAKAIHCRELFIKRDDLTGLAFGGNKTRELDFIIGDAVAARSDVLIAGGGVAQSNHARQCAAAALRAGLEPIIVLRRNGIQPARTANLLITEMLASRIEWVDVDAELDERDATASSMQAIAGAVAAEGRRPYILHSSFHPLAAVAYVECVLELAGQIDSSRSLTLWVTSMGATHVGLALGVAILGLPWRVVGATWKPALPDLGARLSELSRATAEKLEIISPLAPADFITIDRGGPEYAVPSGESREASWLAARAGLLLDPVYTAKGMAALIGALNDDLIAADETVVFLHTGGLPAIFAYPAT